MIAADFRVGKVREGSEAAAAAGLGPAKVNMVVKRGGNDRQVLDMARHFRGSGHIVRFIEFMDVGSTNGRRMDDVIPARGNVRPHPAELPPGQAGPGHHRGHRPVPPTVDGEEQEGARERRSDERTGVVRTVDTERINVHGRHFRRSPADSMVGQQGRHGSG